MPNRQRHPPIVERNRGVGDQLDETESLGAGGGLETFYGVECLHGCPTDGVGDLEEVHSDNEDYGCGESSGGFGRLLSTGRVGNS